MRFASVTSSRVLSHLLASALALASVGLGPAAGAQSPTLPDLGGAIVAGGEEVAYLRALSLLDSSVASVMIQPFGVGVERRLRARAAEHGPWRERFIAKPGTGGLALGLLRPLGNLTYHSGLPLSRNDGVVWAGKGATVEGQGGLWGRWGRVRAQLAPIAFITENRAFALAPNGRSGDTIYADPRWPRNIDNVQRFGDASYGRLDLGESFLSADLFGVEAGVSSARISWGPGREYAPVMSTNSGGFAHAFIGTAAPWNIGIGRINGRLISGRLHQSHFSPKRLQTPYRFTTGLVGTFSPAGLPGLELGASRVMQVYWPDGGPSLSQILRPFQTVVSDPNLGADPNQNDENQFASLFVRLAPRGSGFEAYGEFTREDFTSNERALISKPDDLAIILYGLMRTWVNAKGEMLVLRFEGVNNETPHTERNNRGDDKPYPAYYHVRTLAGLTSRGQILGSPVAYGGAGGLLALDRYTAEGRTSVAIERQLRFDWLPSFGDTGGTRNAETLYGIRYERVRALGTRELGWVVAPSLVLNRNLEAGRDLWNIELGLRWRGW